MFLLVDTSNDNADRSPVTSRNDYRVESWHKSQEAAERAWDKQLRRCRRQNGGRSYLQRKIVEI